MHKFMASVRMCAWCLAYIRRTHFGALRLRSLNNEKHGGAFFILFTGAWKVAAVLLVCKAYVCNGVHCIYELNVFSWEYVSGRPKGI